MGGDSWEVQGVERVMDKNWTIRVLKETDIGAFWDLISDPTLYRMAASIPPDPPRIFADERIAKQLEQGVFDDRGHLLGCGSLFVKDQTPDKLDVGYSVHRDHRGKGVAKYLLAHLVQEARERGTHAYLSAQVAKDNPASLHLLKSAGFVVIGEGTYYSKGRQAEVPEWRLRKKIMP